MGYQQMETILEKERNVLEFYEDRRLTSRFTSATQESGISSKVSAKLFQKPLERQKSCVSVIHPTYLIVIQSFTNSFTEGTSLSPLTREGMQLPRTDHMLNFRLLKLSKRSLCVSFNLLNYL